MSNLRLCDEESVEMFELMKQLAPDPDSFYPGHIYCFDCWHEAKKKWRVNELGMSKHYDSDDDDGNACVQLLFLFCIPLFFFALCNNYCESDSNHG